MLIIIVHVGGCPIPGSPVVCTVDAAGQARAKGEGLLSGHADKAAHFIVTGTRSPPAVQVFTLGRLLKILLTCIQLLLLKLKCTYVL